MDQFDSDSSPNNDDGDQSEDDEDNTLLTLQSTDLEIVNTVNPNSGNPGDTLTFTIDIVNNGTDRTSSGTILPTFTKFLFCGYEMVPILLPIEIRNYIFTRVESLSFHQGFSQQIETIYLSTCTFNRTGITVRILC